MPLISVIIPTFNRRDLLVGTINSVLRQDFQDLNIIIVDDGSLAGPACPAIYTEHATKIYYYYKSNEGQAVARNYGATRSKSNYLLFLDDDDLLAPGALSTLLRYIEEGGAAAVGGLCRLFGATKGMPILESPGHSRRLRPENFYWGNQFYTPGQVLVRRDAFEQVGGFYGKFRNVEDLDLWIRLAYRGEVRRYEQVVLEYRIHPHSSSSDVRRMRRATTHALYRNLDLFEGEEKERLRIIGNRWLRRHFGRRYAKSIFRHLLKGQPGPAACLTIEAILLKTSEPLGKPVLEPKVH